MADDEQAIELTEDANGWPILLATRAPGQVAAQNTSGSIVLRGAASGNPQADPASGRFAGKAAGRTTTQQGGDVVIVQQTRTLPQGVSQAQWEKRQDIVRNAARTLRQIDPLSAKQYLDAHPDVNSSQVNIDMFVADVKAAKLDDLVDVLDQNLHKTLVKVVAGKPFAKAAFRGLTAEDVTNVITRLQGRGWDTDLLNRHVVSKITNPDVKIKAEQIVGEPKPRSGKRTNLEDPIVVAETELWEEDNDQDEGVALADALSRVAAQMPQPIINVHVDNTKPTRKVVTRDPESKLITSVDEVPVDD